MKNLVTVLGLLFSLSSLSYEMKVASFNIRNFNPSISKYEKNDDATYTDLKELKKLLKSTDAQLIGVQEIVNVSAFKKFVYRNLPNYSVVLTECGGGGSQKLGFIYNRKYLTLKSFKEDMSINPSGDCNRGVRPAAIGIFQEKVTRLDIVAASVHLKAGGSQRNADARYEQYKALTKMINNYKFKGHKNFVVVGDFNTTFYNHRDHNYDRFIDFTSINELKDFARAVKCTSYWRGTRNDGIMYSSLLDHVLISDDLMKEFSSFRVNLHSHCKKVRCENVPKKMLGNTYTNVSDHCPIVTTLEY